MKYSFNIVALLSCLIVVLSAISARSKETGIGPSFKGPIGLQLYSLREQFAKDVPGTLDEVRDMGFKNVETAGTYNLEPAQFKKELESRGLTAVSAHFPLEKFRDDI